MQQPRRGPCQLLRSDLSATLFLCAADEYDGGELTIETQYGAQEVKLDAGNLILYPSTNIHEFKPVTEGARICAFFWIKSMIRDNSQRELLFDLDQSIQALTMAAGAHDPEAPPSSHHNNGELALAGPAGYNTSLSNSP